LQPTYDIIDPNQLDKITLSAAIKRTSFWRVIEDKYLLIVFIGIVLFLNFETRMRDILIGLQRCPNCRRGQLRRERTIKKRRTTSKPGKELMETFCNSCDYSSIEHRSIPSIPD
jgi:hypothetical protein